VPELTEEERLQIMMSEDFQSFFNRSTRLVERVLTEDVDIFTDYSGADNEGKDE
jgi:dynein intermediate chain